MVWVLTLYLEDSIQMFEFDSKKEAKEKCNKIDGYKILSEVIYYTDVEKMEAV
ncbi:hypothetical protein [Pseudobacillus wudalianchiensis]|uniref:hypothetical protein n=1 Tax=Pseudobacillus wudalianchiensis TaxID=1743143 RepID=UPI00159F0FC6|nr:hypothetical protein [Bacillus wudalianchiensis]